MLIQLSHKQKVPHSILVFDYINASNQYVLPGYKILSSLAELAGCMCDNFMLNCLQNGTP
jgi:hypothetical protein